MKYFTVVAIIFFPNAFAHGASSRLSCYDLYSRSAQANMAAASLASVGTLASAYKFSRMARPKTWGLLGAGALYLLLRAQDNLLFTDLMARTIAEARAGEAGGASRAAALILTTSIYAKKSVFGRLSGEQVAVPGRLARAWRARLEGRGVYAEDILRATRTLDASNNLCTAGGDALSPRDWARAIIDVLAPRS